MWNASNWHAANWFGGNWYLGPDGGTPPVPFVRSKKRLGLGLGLCGKRLP